MRKRLHAFTLVELLVVIGIIAVLISILLPALQSARRSANAIKCAASLKEIGNAFRMYSIDYKGYYPLAQLTPRPMYPNGYDIEGFYYGAASETATSTATNPYWPSFLQKYVTKTKQGTSSKTAEEAAAAKNRSIFWGCPTFDGYITTAIGGYNRVQTGYGMNPWPTNARSGPLDQDSTTVGPKVLAWVRPGTPQPLGTWHKATKWTHPGERALITDSRFWMVESLSPPPVADFPPPQPNINNSQTYSPGVAGQTMIDVYRHGKYPAMRDAYTFQKGGKVSYNILYADGHVATHNDQETAYRTTRMRFPG